MLVVYRVVANHVLNHLQWIVVRDTAAGPIMLAGPFIDEHSAGMHCDALNREHIAPPRKSFAHELIAECERAATLVKAGWSGTLGWLWTSDMPSRSQ